MNATLVRTLEEALADVPVLDPHTHLVGGRLGARGLHDVLLYHMRISDLYAAGCPSGARLTQYPGWPDCAEAHARIEAALPHLPDVAHTSMAWGVRIILRDLYGWNEPITAANWRRLDDLIRERGDDRGWHREILRRARIRRTCTEFMRREDGQDDDILQYALEWAFFTRCQWGEFDTALYELERCWGRAPQSPTPIGPGQRAPTERVIRTLDDVHAAMNWYVEHIPAGQLVAVTTHISTDIDFRVISAGEMQHALARRASAGPTERDIYAAYVQESYLTALEARLADRLTYQFSYGAEPLPFETASRLSQRSIAQLAEMIARHPKLRFQCSVSSANANQSLCTLCRELPNLSLAGYWWHNFHPTIIRRVMEERLDLLPVNKQIGFFSDAYVVEWSYAKLVMVKALLARVLAERVELGEFEVTSALAFARATLFDAPQRLLGMQPVNS